MKYDRGISEKKPAEITDNGTGGILEETLQ